MKLEISYKKKTGKNTNMWILNNMLPNNQWIKEQIKQEIKNLRNGILTDLLLAMKIEAVFKKLPANKSPGPDVFTGKFYHTYKAKLVATLLKLCLLYTSPSPRDRQKSRMPSSA